LIAPRHRRLLIQLLRVFMFLVHVWMDSPSADLSRKAPVRHRTVEFRACAADPAFWDCRSPGGVDTHMCMCRLLGAPEFRICKRHSP
jgi:hypothetical protein